VSFGVAIRAIDCELISMKKPIVKDVKIKKPEVALKTGVELTDRQRRVFAEFAGRKGGKGAPHTVAADPEASDTDS